MLYNNYCQILMRRFSNTFVCTRGELMLHTTKFQTLEPSKFIIPQGEYQLQFTNSPKFSKLYPYNSVFNKKVPEIIGIPNHSGVRIHVGNYPSDSQGCILLGTAGTDHSVTNSSLAYRNFVSIIGKLMIDNPNVFFTLKIYNDYD